MNILQTVVSRDPRHAMFLRMRWRTGIWDSGFGIRKNAFVFFESQIPNP